VVLAAGAVVVGLNRVSIGEHRLGDAAIAVSDEPGLLSGGITLPIDPTSRVVMGDARLLVSDRTDGVGDAESGLPAKGIVGRPRVGTAGVARPLHLPIAGPIVRLSIGDYRAR